MMKLLAQAIKGHLIKALGTMLFALALASCSDTDGPPEDLIGVAASGAAIEGTIYVVDSAGVEISKTINADGFFRLDVRGMTAPFILKTVANNGTDPELFGYAAEANVTVNVTPLTNLAMFIANGNADPTDLYNNWPSTFGNISTAALKDAMATINANLRTQFIAFSLDPLVYDFVATRFATNGATFDGLLDALTVDISAGINVSVAGIGALVFDTGIDITGYDIGGTSVIDAGTYRVSVAVAVNGASTSLALVNNLPASDLPIAGNTQMVEDLFYSYLGGVGPIVMNSVTVTGDASVTTVVIDATITTTDGDKNYVATYTYTQNV